MKRRGFAVAGAALLAAAGLGAALFPRPGAPVKVEIPEGLSGRQTVELLREKGVVRSVAAYRAYLKLTGSDRRLKPGAYTFREREWPSTLTRKLTLGVVDDVKVTIPEGFRASQIAERLEAAGVANALEFEALAKARKLEGRLFPSTYYLPKRYGAERAAEKMISEFMRNIGAAYASASPKPELSLDQALIVASIVEREAQLAPERPMVAAVYLNRLKKRMPLQADPTVQYALGRWKKGLTTKDLQIDSPYNTYKHRGLPPGPICSPGLSAFEAVLRPAQTTALYFVADMRGGHIFSSTYEKHQEAHRNYRKDLSAEKRRLREEKRRRDAEARQRGR